MARMSIARTETNGTIDRPSESIWFKNDIGINPGVVTFDPIECADKRLARPIISQLRSPALQGTVTIRLMIATGALFRAVMVRMLGAGIAHPRCLCQKMLPGSRSNYLQAGRSQKPIDNNAQ